MKDVLIIDKLIEQKINRITIEKTYHGMYNGVKVGCVLWATFNHKKNRWNRWHPNYYFPDTCGEVYYTDAKEFWNAIEQRTLRISA